MSSSSPSRSRKRCAWPVQHDMKQGFVLTQYFYEQMTQFEKDPASLKDDIGEMVYGMDVEQQVHRARQIEFDKEADSEVLGRSKPHKLAGWIWPRTKLSSGDIAGASAMAQKVLAEQSDTVASAADSARAWFILARAAAMTGHPDQAIDDFQKTLATSKEQRLLAWSHIYLGRMLDLDCKRDEAMSEYKLALTVRDGREDTRLAAERGVKNAYSVNGHTCDEDADGRSAQPGSSRQNRNGNSSAERDGKAAIVWPQRSASPKVASESNNDGGHCPPVAPGGFLLPKLH